MDPAYTQVSTLQATMPLVGRIVFIGWLAVIGLILLACKQGATTYLAHIDSSYSPYHS